VGTADEPSPYQLEWDHLIEAIREDKPFNEVERGAIASLVTSMGRMAAHTGRIITYDEMLNCDHEMAPERRPVDRGLRGPAAAERRRRLPHPAARHHHRPRIRLTGLPTRRSAVPNQELAVRRSVLNRTVFVPTGAT
jgi:hypothetical protein